MAHHHFGVDRLVELAVEPGDLRVRTANDERQALNETDVVTAATDLLQVRHYLADRCFRNGRARRDEEHGFGMRRGERRAGGRGSGLEQ